MRNDVLLNEFRVLKMRLEELLNQDAIITLRKVELHLAGESHLIPGRETEITKKRISSREEKLRATYKYAFNKYDVNRPSLEHWVTEELAKPERRVDRKAEKKRLERNKKISDGIIRNKALRNKAQK
jgi:hypothetical protein